MGMDVGRRVGVVVPVGMPVAIGMGAGMVVTMGVRRGGNHPKMLYYNITPVHGPGRHSGTHDVRTRNLAPQLPDSDSPWRRPE